MQRKFSMSSEYSFIIFFFSCSYGKESFMVWYHYWLIFSYKKLEYFVQSQCNYCRTLWITVKWSRQRTQICRLATVHEMWKTTYFMDAWLVKEIPQFHNLLPCFINFWIHSSGLRLLCENMHRAIRQRRETNISTARLFFENTRRYSLYWLLLFPNNYIVRMDSFCMWFAMTIHFTEVNPNAGHINIRYACSDEPFLHTVFLWVSLREHVLPIKVNVDYMLVVTF